MPKPKAPSIVQPITFPVFGMCWFGSNGSSIVAYCGGGGSAKTGVFNKIIVQFLGTKKKKKLEEEEEDNESITINTGDDVCVAVQVYEDPISKEVWLLGAIGSKVQRYRLVIPSEDNNNNNSNDNNRNNDSNDNNDDEGSSCSITKAGSIDVGNGTNTLGVHAMGQVFAVGCDNGTVHVIQMTTTDTTTDTTTANPWTTLFVCEGHVKAVCAVQFALRSDFIISSAKDGTARVWKAGGLCVATLTCDITDPKAPKPKKGSSHKNGSSNKNNNNKRPPQVLVRGCAFGDLEGKVVYTIASGRKGKAFLSRWVQQDNNKDNSNNNNNNKNFQCDSRLAVHGYPISAMNLSSDASLMALGGVDGTILLFDIDKWKVVKKFHELHHLPVTCIAARPYSTPLKGDGEVPFHAISASADSQMGLLTLQRRVPRKVKAASAGGGEMMLHGSPFSWLALLLYYPLAVLVYFILTDALQLCSDDWSLDCIHHTVLMAATTRPGILVPPH